MRLRVPQQAHQKRTRAIRVGWRGGGHDRYRRVRRIACQLRITARGTRRVCWRPADTRRCGRRISRGRPGGCPHHGRGTIRGRTTATSRRRATSLRRRRATRRGTPSATTATAATTPAYQRCTQRTITPRSARPRLARRPMRRRRLHAKRARRRGPPRRPHRRPHRRPARPVRVVHVWATATRSRPGVEREEVGRRRDIGPDGVGSIRPTHVRRHRQWLRRGRGGGAGTARRRRRRRPAAAAEAHRRHGVDGEIGRRRDTGH